MTRAGPNSPAAPRLLSLTVKILPTLVIETAASPEGATASTPSPQFLQSVRGGLSLPAASIDAATTASGTSRHEPPFNGTATAQLTPSLIQISVRRPLASNAPSTSLIPPSVGSR